MILNLIFGLALFITGGHIVDTKFGLHHYNDEDYKQIFYLENKTSTSKKCIRHSEFEDIKKIRRHRPNNDGGEMVTVYKVTKIKTKKNPAL
tara:strand:+ start:12771 stop:13043 length:273 start_codon:yes stop_codon:yes gene_type:complete